jgi:hypothetical protein
MQQVNQQVLQTLQQSGYSPSQARTLMNLANQMSRGQDVTVEQPWLRGKDLDRTAQALHDARLNPEARRSISSNLSIAGPKGASMTEQQMESRLVATLRGRGYTAQQASRVMGLAQTLANGGNITIRESWTNTNDVNAVARALANARARPGDRASIAAGVDIHGPPRQPKLRAVPTKAPARTYAYKVEMGGRTYVIESATRYNAKGIGKGIPGLRASRVGQIRGALIERNQSGMRIYSVSASGKRTELNAAQRDRFTQAYNARFSRMERDIRQREQGRTRRESGTGEPIEQLIHISSVRKPPAGGSQSSG